MLKKIIILVVIIAVLGGGFLLIQSNNSVEQSSANVKLVKTELVEKETLITEASADGNVKAWEEKDIKALLAGTVENVFVEDGDFLEEGTHLYSIDDRNLRNSLKTALLNCEEAKLSYESLLDSYENQDRMNNLQLEETRKNLEIAILSYQQEKSSLEEQELKFEQELEEIRDGLKKAEKDLNDNQYLYEKNAIPLNTLEESREKYQELKRNYIRAENNLNTFLEKSMPNSLELAQLKIDNARNQLDYLEASLEVERISEKDLEIAKLKVANVEAEIEKIREDLGMAVTYSPMTGTVINLDIKEGDRIVEGATIGTIADLDAFIVEVMVDEIDVNEVSVGQEVIITSDSFAAELKGIVNFIAPAGTNVGNINKYRTEINIIEDMGLLRSGMFVNAEIITNRLVDVIAVPSLAILGDEEKYVFVVEDGVASKRIIETGMRSLSKVEISGIEAGEKVIIGPYTILSEMEEGMAVAETEM